MKRERRGCRESDLSGLNAARADPRFPVRFASSNPRMRWARSACVDAALEQGRANGDPLPYLFQGGDVVGVHGDEVVLVQKGVQLVQVQALELEALHLLLCGPLVSPRSARAPRDGFARTLLALMTEKPCVTRNR